jgi:NAD(P)-dependent dehydrogenase (short-subunit alcohol dehydrogenase family)
MNLNNKVAIVTGAADGIGKASARAFAEHGADVVLADIESEANMQAAIEIAQSTGRETLAVTCDVSNDDELRQLLNACIDRFGHCDILLNNAGIITTGDILDLDTDDFDRVMSVNLRACFVLSQLVARHMIASDIEGAIINMASLNSVLAIPNQLAYVTSKGGLQQLTKATALRLAEHNIRVNAIGPGSIKTKVLGAVMTDEAARQRILSRTPLRRLGEPEEVASIAVFLASDYASYITGQTIYPDGGRAALNYTVPVDES